MHVNYNKAYNIIRTLTSEDLSEDNSLDYTEKYQNYPGLHPVPIKAQLDEGEKDFLIHPITSPSYMLRQPAYLWFNSVLNVINMQSLKVRARIYPEALWNHGRMWLTYLLVVSLALTPSAYPDSWSFDPPLVITPARFHK